MPDSFFQSDKKRKRSKPGGGGGGGGRAGPSSRPKPKAPRRQEKDEELESDAEGEGANVDLDSMDFRAGRGDEDIHSDEELIDENETAAEKRVRMAKGYLAKVRKELQEGQDDEDYDAAEIDRDLIASRLQHDVAEVQGKIHNYISTKVGTPSTKFISTPGQLPTSASLTTTHIYTSTKRGVVLPISLDTMAKPKKSYGKDHHKGELLCIAASEDGKYLVSAGRDKLLGVWDTSGAEPVWKHGIPGHKDAVTSVVIPPVGNPSHHLLSASLSRHLGLHSLSTLSIIDTFFGHQDSITSVSALKPSVAVTAGSRDRTCRWWKVEEEVQLVFRGGGKTFEGAKGLAKEEKKERPGGGYYPGEEPAEKPKLDKKGKRKEFVEGSLDTVCVLDEQHFLSGGDSGSLSLWHTGKKKPIFTQAFAHGIDETPRWITSIAHLRGSDLFVSGSWDGQIRVWALDSSLRSFSQVLSLPVGGFINSLQILSLPPKSTSLSTEDKNQIILAAAVSQEPRLGRWMTKKDAKNGIFVAYLPVE